MRFMLSVVGVLTLGLAFLGCQLEREVHYVTLGEAIEAQKQVYALEFAPEFGYEDIQVLEVRSGNRGAGYYYADADFLIGPASGVHFALTARFMHVDNDPTGWFFAYDF